MYSSDFWAFVIDRSKIKDQSSFYEINIKAFNRVNRKQLKFRKTLLECLEFYIVAYWKWFGSRSCLGNCILEAVAYKLVAYIKKCICLRIHWRFSTILKTSKKVYEIMFFWYVKVYIFWRFIRYTKHWNAKKC